MSDIFGHGIYEGQFHYSFKVPVLNEQVIGEA
jgi:hypothetical protein